MTGSSGLPPPRPKSRRTLAKEERRLALISATIRSIADFGLSGTTIARVTGMAGASIGLANFHFENKERLFEATLRHLAEAERAVWRRLNDDGAPTPANRLVALMDARFDPEVCNRRTLAVWFAFWGDAGARDIYRRVVGARDDERLHACVAILRSLVQDAGGRHRDAMQTALGLEAFYDGLWLNHLLYPDAFGRLDCRQIALDHLAALFPAHMTALSTAAAPASHGV
jgi:TetR/AcrR family transcriptional repressor of bet genes